VSQIKQTNVQKNKFKKFEEDEIKKENQRIIEKIIFKTSELSKNKFLTEYEKNAQYKKNISKLPDYKESDSDKFKYKINYCFVQIISKIRGIRKFLLQKNVMIREKYPIIEKANKSVLLESKVFCLFY